MAFVRPQSHKQVYQGQIKPLTRSSAQAQDLAAMVVPSGRYADASIDLPMIRLYRKPIKVTLRIPFPMTGNVGTLAAFIPPTVFKEIVELALTREIEGLSGFPLPICMRLVELVKIFTPNRDHQVTQTFKQGNIVIVKNS